MQKRTILTAGLLLLALSSHNAKAQGRELEDEYENSQKNATNRVYKPNYLAISPFHVTNHGLGLSLSYDRILDKEGYLSISLPIVYSYNQGSNYYDPYYNQNAHFTDNVFYTYPGFKVHPASAHRKVNYGVGVAGAFGFGNRQEDYYDYNTNQLKYREYDIKRIGVMLEQSLYFQPNNMLFFGFDFGIGQIFHAEPEFRDRYNTQPMVHFDFKIGVRL